MSNSGIPAAQYLRMSTEHQQYSLENQAAAIARYAACHGFAVTATYSDAGKRGLWLKNRAGLQALLQDVVTGPPNYKVILVYDVSRWGRFQDMDEAAHYEFLCKSAGIPIHYCAELFTNDNSLPNLIMKALKRTMAGEYSRELSAKVYDGQKRLAQLGFKQGGVSGYGLRRMLISADGTPKQTLAPGERKSLQTERVIVVPGAADEVACVREIFRMLIEDSRTVYGIAKDLNRRGIKFVDGADWDYQAVYQILTAAKYAGCYVWGRTTQKLGSKALRRPPSQWVVVPDAFESIVDSMTFAKAQAILQARTVHMPNEELLARLRTVLGREGRISLSVLKRYPEIPSLGIFRLRFGSIRNAYKLIGYGRPDEFSFLEARQRNHLLREKLMNELVTLFPGKVEIDQRSGRWRSRLRVGNRLVSVLVSRSIQIAGGVTGWLIDPVPRESRLRTLLGRMNEARDGFQDFHLLPNIDLRGRFQVTDRDPWLKRGRKVRDDLTDFCLAVQEVA